jgi:hypothetical protein
VFVWNIVVCVEFGLEFYTDVLDLDYLLDHLNDSDKSYGTDRRFMSLNSAICALVQDFGCTSFVPVAIEDKTSVHTALKAIDKANGYAFSGMDAVYAQRAVKAETERKNAAFAAAAAASKARGSKAVPITIPPSNATGAGAERAPTADELKRAAAHPLFTAVSVDTEFDYFRTQAMSDQYRVPEHDPELESKQSTPTTATTGTAGATTDINANANGKAVPLSAQPPESMAVPGNRSSQWKSTAAASAVANAATALAPTNTPPASIVASIAPKSAKPKSVPLRTCSNCGKRELRIAEFKKCSRCRAVHYCSTDCQSAAWPTHKLECTSPPATIPSAANTNISSSQVSTK